MLSVYVVCWIFLQTFQTYFCIQTNSVDPDQTALSPHCLQKWLLKSKADYKADNNFCCDWQLKGLMLKIHLVDFFCHFVQMRQLLWLPILLSHS